MSTSKNRRLSAILFTDIVGYTVLLQKINGHPFLAWHQFWPPICVSKMTPLFRKLESSKGFKGLTEDGIAKSALIILFVKCFFLLDDFIHLKNVQGI